MTHIRPAFFFGDGGNNYVRIPRDLSFSEICRLNGVPRMAQTNFIAVREVSPWEQFKETE